MKGYKAILECVMAIAKVTGDVLDSSVLLSTTFGVHYAIKTKNNLKALTQSSRAYFRWDVYTVIVLYF